MKLLKIVEALNENNEVVSESQKDSGIASIIITAINDEWEAIDFYNSMIATAQAEGYQDVVEVAKDILNEENIHVGQLQKLLELVQPEAKAIEQGMQEATEQVIEGTDVIESLDDRDPILDGKRLYAVIDTNDEGVKTFYFNSHDEYKSFIRDNKDNIRKQISFGLCK